MVGHRIIIDTDPGIDDAMAIFYALASPELEVLGLTTVYGNVDVGLATDNALRLLEIAGAAEIPVARGAARPLAQRYTGPVPFVHGDDGQGNVGLPPPNGTADRRRATEFIIETAAAAPGEVTLVTLGPVTNIALALIERPDLTELVREVVMMGGNLHGPGNASTAAEANVLNDPEAAEIVFSAPWSVTMCGLDVTHRIRMTPDDLERVYRVPSPAGRHLAAIVPYYQAFYEREVGTRGIYVHDSTPISYLLHPDAFTVERHAVLVDTGSGVGRGKTWPAATRDEAGRADAGADRPTVTVCVGADERRVVESEIRALESAAGL